MRRAMLVDVHRKASYNKILYQICNYVPSQYIRRGWGPVEDNLDHTEHRYYALMVAEPG